MKYKIFVFVLLLISMSASAQNYNLRTNLLNDVMTDMHVSAEAVLSGDFSLEMSVNVNPWTFADNHKKKHVLFQPSLRYWTCTPLNGSFWGVHAHYGRYNHSGLTPWSLGDSKILGSGSENIQNSRYQGWLAGAGISYGYHYILTKRLGLEFEIGVGYAYLQYDKFPCTQCGRKIKDQHKNYFGPTKASISLVYYIK